MSQKIQSKNKITIHHNDPVCQKHFEFLEYDHRQQITEEGAISSVLTFLTNRNTFENESCTPLRIDEVTVLEHRFLVHYAIFRKVSSYNIIINHLLFEIVIFSVLGIVDRVFLISNSFNMICEIYLICFIDDFKNVRYVKDRNDLIFFLRSKAPSFVYRNHRFSYIKLHKKYA